MKKMNFIPLLIPAAIAATLSPLPRQIFVPPAPTEESTITPDSTSGCTPFGCFPTEKTTAPTITATRTTEKRNGLYVYEVHLTANGYGEVIEMVSGRPWKQDTGEEDVADTGSPLPVGPYAILPTIQSAPAAKFGGIFIPFEPMFTTARYDLGFHHDPEFATGGPELGTMGCLATITEGDRQKLINFIRTHKPTKLVVK